MRKLFIGALVLSAAIAIHGADWPAQSGNPQKDGWARSEKAFTPENASKIELLYKYKADNKARGPRALTSPLINGMLITYLGFKEMLVFGGSSDNVYSVDADLNRIIWRRHFEYNGDKPEAAPTAACPGGLTASVAMPGSSSAAPGRGFAGPGRAGLFSTGFGRSGVFIAVSGDGFLHALNTSTGADKVPPAKFLPANSKAGPLTINDSIVYTATKDGCGGAPDAIYALDMSGNEYKLSSFPAAATGMAIGTDGTIYARTRDGILALTKDLKSKGSFPLADAADVAPVVFQWKGKDLVVAGGTSGRLYLMDAAATRPSEPAGGALEGALSTGEDDAGTRWIYASTNSAVTAFRVEDRSGAPVPVLAWTSPNIAGAVSLVNANGLVFALSGGKPPSGRATLYVLDALTGKPLYSYAAATFTQDAGLAVANRRIYFTDHDNTVYCLGFMAEQPQLTGR